MRKAIVFFWLLVSVWEPSHAAALPDKESFHLFLLVGQSNMAGRGVVDEAAKTAHPRVLMFDKQREWKPAVDPLHFDKPNIVGVGPGRAFANAVAEANPEIVVGLIPCAVGGSPISAWQAGAFYKPTKSHPWDDALARAEVALKDGQLKGILWHQGESDSKPDLAEQYGEKLHELIGQFRAELDSSDVPFVVGQMGIFSERPWSEAKHQVDRAHKEVSKKVSRSGFASAEGLNHKGDEVHFDTDSARTLGRRYFEVWRALSVKQ